MLRRIDPKALAAAAALTLATCLGVAAQDSGGCTTQGYRDAVHSRESVGADYGTISKDGMLGRYQFDPGTLARMGYMSGAQWTGKDGVFSTQDFLSNKQAQENAFSQYETAAWQELQRNGATQYIGQTMPNGTTITASSLLMGCQFGCKKVTNYLSGGMQCNASTSDGNGVCVQSFMTTGSGYDVSSFTSGQGAAGGGGCGKSDQQSAEDKQKDEESKANQKEWATCSCP